VVVSQLFQTGSVIDGKYRVTRHIGEGGMGSVYEGENVRIGRKIAIKVLHGDLPKTPELVSRFEREARAAARVGSPYICDVLDLGDLETGDRFIVMEYLEGDNLEERLEKVGRISQVDVATIAFELLAGLASVHDAGIVHRDLKPANLFLSKTPRGRGEVVKILDFGVSKFLPVGDADSANVTQTGAVMGTPLFMSPEQARGAKEIDGRSDLYSAAAIMYRALTGCYPLLGENFHDLLFKIALEAPKPIQELCPDVDPVLAGIIMKGLAKKPEERWATARDFHEAIAGWARSNAPVSLQLLSMGSMSGMAVAAAMSTPATPILSPLHGAQNTPSTGSPVARTQTSWVGERPPSGSQPAAKELPSGESLEKAATQIAPSTPYGAPVTAAAPPAPSRRGALIGAVAVGFLLVGGGVAAVVIPSAHSRGAASTESPPASVAPPTPTEVPPVVATAEPPEPPANAAPAASAAVTADPPASATAVAGSRPHGARQPSVAVKAPSTTAATPPPASAARPPTAPTPSKRVFRTTFD
jgi:eukaryotic-like serine/threonine-protein kinase